MSKFVCLLAAAAFALFSPATLADTPKALSLLPTITSHTAAPRAAEALTLEHQGPIAPLNHIVVGHAREYSRDNDVHTPSHLREQARFLRGLMEQTGLLDQLGNLLDVHEDVRPWDKMTRVHLLSAVPVAGKWTPFATVARQVDASEVAERLGVGAGVLFTFQKHVTLASEILYLGSERTAGGAGFDREALFMTRLQIGF